MGIREYLDRTGESTEDFAKRAKVAMTSVYRWLEQEDQFKRVKAISIANLTKIINASNGIITAESVLGIGRKRRRAA